jgi:hypothetical protein
MKPQRTILVTFAGRRDRMELLTRYVTAAMDAGLIDEWHVWDFTRNAQDGAWLRDASPLFRRRRATRSNIFAAPEA